MVEMDVVDVRIEELTKSPFVELRARDVQGRLLPIFIGIAEASAIKRGLERRSTPRPLTHDLLSLVLDAVGAELEQVVITEFRNKIFYAELHLGVGAQRRTVSCRPSDAIALAVRRGVSVFVNDAVLEECGVVDRDALRETTGAEPVGDPEHLFDEFRRFIDDIDPDDFKGEPDDFKGEPDDVKGEPDDVRGEGGGIKGESDKGDPDDLTGEGGDVKGE